MRRLLKLVSATGLALALASSAQANTFSGDVSFRLSTLPGLYALGSGSGKTRVVPNLITLPTSAFAGTGPVLITLQPTALPPLSALSIRLTAPAGCTFTGTPVGGACALGGTANALVGGAPFLVVPLSGLGVAGRFSFGPWGSYIDARSWTAGTAVITINGITLTTNGLPIAMVGYDHRVVSGEYPGEGLVKLVAPAGLMSTLGGNLPLFVSMSIHFGPVPEPGTLLLLGSGIVGLALLGRSRMRSRF